MKRKRTDLSEVLYPLHPAFPEGTVFTYDDCYRISAELGLSPQTLAAFLVGRLFPHNIMIERLKTYFGEELVTEILLDFEPTRWFIFENPDKIRKRRVKQRFPASMLRVNDCIRVNDGRWLRISDVRTTGSFVVIYSGGAKVTRISKNNLLIVHLGRNTQSSTQELAETQKTKDKLRKELDDFLGDNEDEFLRRAEIFQSVLKDYKKSQKKTD